PTSVCLLSFMLSFLSYSPPPPFSSHSFPTRRSSDLISWTADGEQERLTAPDGDPFIDVAVADGSSTAGEAAVLGLTKSGKVLAADRKSTRLNSSHVSISYAVFCLNKKMHQQHVNASA